MSPDLISTSTSNNEEPEAYRIGWVPFLGTKIFLDSRPLIPRTETEWWVGKLVESLESRVEKEKREIRVLDLFAGSGCVGIAVLRHVPQAHVTLGELESRHLTTIEKNIRENSIDSARARVVRTDVYSDTRGHYDFILANPPYLSRARLARIQGSVLEHEPSEALFANDDGFELIQRTIEGLPDHLAHGGQCWIAHEPEHAARIQESARRLGLSAKTYEDQYGVNRYSVILNP